MGQVFIMWEPHYSGDNISPIRKKLEWGLGGKINVHQTQTWAREGISRWWFLLPAESWKCPQLTQTQTPLFPKCSRPHAVSRGVIHLCSGPAMPSALGRVAHSSWLQWHWFHASVPDRRPPAVLYPATLPSLLLLGRNNLHLLRTHRGVARVLFRYV